MLLLGLLLGIGAVGFVFFAVGRFQFQLYPNWGQLKIQKLALLNLAPVLPGSRTIRQHGNYINDRKHHSLL